MKLKILGCSGGIGGKYLRTTSMLLDSDILIDAGTGVMDLTLAELSLIDHVFLTHSHLDHVAALPLMLDSVADMRNKRAVTLYATAATLEIIRKHIFNWKIWPDFTEIPNAKQPLLRYETIRVGQALEIGNREITPLPANHTVPAVGYHLNSGKGSLIFTGDTTTQDALWDIINKIENLRYLIIETAFSNREKDLAIRSKHLCPSLLASELEKLERSLEVFITHLKPGEIELIMQEIQENAGVCSPRMLQNNQIFEF